mmetsp:Transcript_37496/g.60752  ORF Transcript_37496/g.60752 Transcript_37496/m.60752 type:complete len:155 (+) Transcript_37496:1299-1763(+)
MPRAPTRAIPLTETAYWSLAPQHARAVALSVSMAGVCAPSAVQVTSARPTNPSVTIIDATRSIRTPTTKQHPIVATALRQGRGVCLPPSANAPTAETPSPTSVWIDQVAVTWTLASTTTAATTPMVPNVTKTPPATLPQVDVNPAPFVPILARV